MKNIFFSTLFIIFLSTSCKAQNDFINTNQVRINGHPVFKATIDFLIENFGQPVNVENYFFEMENTNGLLYDYSGLYFYLINDKVEAFEITSFLFVFSTNNISVGQNITSLQSIFPNSYQNKSEDEIIISFNDADYFISINYDSNDIIQKISLNVY